VSNPPAASGGILSRTAAPGATGPLVLGCAVWAGLLALYMAWETAPFARRGLRNAFVWIGGSSIASIIFVNLGFSWMTGLVLAATLLLGTQAFLSPVRGLHRRIRAAKEAELQRVRAAIQQTRGSLLDPSVRDAASRMPGLLAYEHRIESVQEWPLDAPQIARFSLMIAVGLGSWLGGAVVGHVVDLFWH